MHTHIDTEGGRERRRESVIERERERKREKLCVSACVRARGRERGKERCQENERGTEIEGEREGEKERVPNAYRNKLKIPTTVCDFCRLASPDLGQPFHHFELLNNKNRTHNTNTCVFVK